MVGGGTECMEEFHTFFKKKFNTSLNLDINKVSQHSKVLKIEMLLDYPRTLHRHLHSNNLCRN